MPARVYSYRFADIAGGGAAIEWWVPNGLRAVVKFVSYMSQAASCRVYISVNGKYVWLKDLPVTLTGGGEELRLVAYAGERLVLLTSGADIGAHMSGYLFQVDAVVGDIEPPREVPLSELELPAGYYS